MEIIEEKVNSQNNEMTISIRCPVCKLKKDLRFPKSVINQAKQLTTISIPKDLICEHHFQAFVDKNFVVRGYQKVDFEYEVKFKNSLPNSNGREFSEYIVIEENYLASKPKDNQIIIERKIRDNFENQSKLKMNREDIYNEFWDFIDEKNKDFQDFIKSDKRRSNLEKFY
ncbi:MAG: hypothetical protein ACFFEO_06335 [Candidatus Thorarchaeota archaeon]